MPNVGRDGRKLTRTTSNSLTLTEAKAAVIQAIDARRDRIFEIGETILRRPELGYKEFETSALVQKVFGEMGLRFRKDIAVTGVVASLPGRGAAATVAILGELDSVLCPNHPHADPSTGAAHSCGHNAQIAAMIGAGMGLLDSGVNRHLDGEVRLMAVPAEEPVEIEFRLRLAREGKTRFLGGKQEFVALGEFDGVDAAMLCHLGTKREDTRKVTVGGTSNGFIAKFIRYIGKEAHAGGAPHAGVNALNAAMLGLMGIHAQRETFKDEDHIRVHPIMTRGGDLVNIIPADVRLETYVRGAAMPAVADASAKVNRALQAGALAIGATCEVTEVPGFLPLFHDDALTALFRANAAALVGEEEVSDGKHGTGSTDMGDVAHLIPAIHPHIAAAEGRGHSEDYRIVDPELAYLMPAKAMAMTAIDLLWDGAGGARALRAAYQPRYTRESYLAMWAEVTGKKG
jgi:amidohydrolase